MAAAVIRKIVASASQNLRGRPKRIRDGPDQLRGVLGGANDWLLKGWVVGT